VAQSYHKLSADPSIQRNIIATVEVGAEQALRLEAEFALTQEKLTIALKLLNQGIEIETIAQATGLTIAQLRQLQVG
jgi:predicted transposase/invertase (TIGR01784 family)